MTCKIIAQASSRYSAKYHVKARGRVYEARVEDYPGEDFVVHIEGIERESELFRSIKCAVLTEWLGNEVAT